MVAFFLLVLIAMLIHYWYVVVTGFGLWLLAGLLTRWRDLERQRTEESRRDQRARAEIATVARITTQAMIEATRDRRP
jgi:predicted tellurium resistance membrane protein TerC